MGGGRVYTQGVRFWSGNSMSAGAAVNTSRAHTSGYDANQKRNTMIDPAISTPQSDSHPAKRWPTVAPRWAWLAALLLFGSLCMSGCGGCTSTPDPEEKPKT